MEGSVEFFAGVCPWLHIDGSLAGKECGRQIQLDNEVALQGHLTHQGFIKVDCDRLWGSGDPGAGTSPCPPWVQRLCDRLSRGIAAIAEAGYSPNYILLFDEAWLLQALVGGFISRVSGGNSVAIGDWAIFNVAAHPAASLAAHIEAEEEKKEEADLRPAAAAKGWPPHRDRPLPTAQAVSASLRPEDGGSARYTTVWISLTDATPESSCLYCIPRPHDPGYSDGDAPGASPLSGALREPADYQRILALPVPAGSLLAFTHRLLHWGSAPLSPVPGQDPPAPRRAISMAFADPSFEQPYFIDPEAMGCVMGTRSKGEGQPMPPVYARLALAAGQCLAYAHQAPLSAEHASTCVRVFKEHAHLFSEKYRDRVLSAGRWAAFTSSAKGATLRSTGAPSAAEVGLLFCAYERAQEGLDAVAYL